MGSDNTHAEGATSVQAGNAEKRPPEIVVVNERVQKVVKEMTFELSDPTVEIS